MKNAFFKLSLLSRTRNCLASYPSEPEHEEQVTNGASASLRKTTGHSF